MVSFRKECYQLYSIILISFREVLHIVASVLKMCLTHIKALVDTSAADNSFIEIPPPEIFSKSSAADLLYVGKG